MIKKIKFHNYIYGYGFSVFEFSLIILVLFPYMVFYFHRGSYTYAFICLGIILNSALIMFLALHSLILKKKDLSIKQFFNKESRIRKYTKYPNLQRETYFLALIVLLPFLLCLLIILDIPRSKS
jgi:hypothetical protein